MARPLFVVIFSLLAAGFSGCVLPGGDVAESQAIVKKVLALITPESMDEADGFEDIVSTSFEYTHGGDDTPVSGITVEFLDEDGDTVDRPIDQYTSRETLRAGDIVTIDRVNLTSGLKVLHDGVVLAERDGLRVDWFTAEGAPIPLSSTEGGLLRYDLDATADFSISGHDFSTADDEMEIRSLTGALEGLADGTITVQTSSLAAGPRIQFDARLGASQSANADVVYVEEGVEKNTGFDIDVSSTLNGTGMLQFDDRHRLVRAGSGGDAWADGAMVAWNEDHPRSENWEPEDFEHPLFQEREEYTEEDVDTDSGDVSDAVREFLTRLWNTRIGVGDEFRLQASDESEDNDGRGFEFNLVVQVVSMEERDVAGTEMETFRVSEVVSFVANAPETGQHDFEMARNTVWISTEHHLPVFVQGNYQKTFDRDDLERIMGALPEEEGFTVPDDGSFVLGGELTLNLAEYSGNLKVAPLIGLAGWSGMGQYAVAAAAAFTMVSDIGSQSYEAAPSVALAPDESSDEITVTAATSDADWSRLSLSTHADGVHFAVNEDATLLSEELTPGQYAMLGFGTVVAGDYVSVCSEDVTASDIEFTMRDDPTNSIMFVATFEDIRLCGGTAGPPSGDMAVTVKNLMYTPKEVTISVGDTVSWTNEDPLVHDVTPKGSTTSWSPGGKGGMSNGETFMRSFETAGTFEYYCQEHGAGMSGKVIVLA